MKSRNLNRILLRNSFDSIIIRMALAAFLLWAAAGMAFAGIVYSNFNPGTGSGYDGTTFYQVSNSGFNGTYYTSTSIAVAFTVPAGSDYRLDKIEVVATQSTDYGSYLHAYIVTDPRFRTTDYNSTTALTATPTLMSFNCTSANMTLKASQTYYLVIEVDTGNFLSVANWYKNSAGINGTVWYNDPSHGDATYHNLGTNLQYPVFRISGTSKTSPSPALSTEMNTVGGNYEADGYYKGTDYHLYQLSYTGLWNHADVTTLAGAPLMDLLSPIASQVDALYNKSEVFYLDSNQNIEALLFDNATKTWSHKNITAAAGAPAAKAGSPLVSLVNQYGKSIQVDYLDSAGHIHELFSRDRTTWTGGDLAFATGVRQRPPTAHCSPWTIRYLERCRCTILIRHTLSVRFHGGIPLTDGPRLTRLPVALRPLN